MPEITIVDVWTRIAADLLATTGRTLRLEVRTADQRWWELDVFVDDAIVTSLGHIFEERGEPALVSLAGYLRDSAFDEEVWGGWPTCPIHATHPLDPVLGDSGRASWACPAGSTIAVIGELNRAGDTPTTRVQPR